MVAAVAIRHVNRHRFTRFYCRYGMVSTFLPLTTTTTSLSSVRAKKWNDVSVCTSSVLVHMYYVSRAVRGLLWESVGGCAWAT